MRPTMGVSFRRPLDSHPDCGRDARVPRDDSPNLDCTLEGSVFPDLEILWGPERLQWCVCVIFQKRVDRFGNCDEGVGRGKRAGRGERGSMRYGFVHFCAIFSNFWGKMSALSALPPPPLQNICSNTCLKRGSEISVRLWNFAGFLTRNCSFFAYFCATERKRKLFARAGLPACARRYGWHDGRSIAQMVESGKFGWALGASQNRGAFLATSGQPPGLRARRPRSQGRFPKSGLSPFARVQGRRVPAEWHREELAGWTSLLGHESPIDRHDMADYIRGPI